MTSAIEDIEIITVEVPMGPQVISVVEPGPPGPAGPPGPPGTGVPNGGAANSVLSKVDATDGNTEWVIATSSATVNTIVRRSASSTIDINYARLNQTPTDSNHATRKDYVDAIGTTAKTGNTIMRRDVNGWTNVTGVAGTEFTASIAPSAADRLTRKDYVDGIGTDSPNASTIVRRDSGGSTNLQALFLIQQPGGPEWATRRDYVDGQVATRAAASHSHAVADISATGTRDSTTFLRGDGTWSTTPAAAGAADATTTSRGLIQLAGDLGGTATAPTVRSSSETQTGIVELATAAETTTGTDTTRAVHPAGLKVELGKKSNTGHTHTAANISDSTATGRSVITAADAAAARTAIGAGTSNLVIGTTSTTAKAGDYSPPTVSETVVGVVELATAAETTTGTDTTRAVHPAGLKVELDKKSNTSHTHTAANISDSTATGRSVLTATDAAAARTAIGAGTSNLVIGTTSTTAKAGDYAPPAATTAATGLVQLTNHLGGTATAPTVRSASDTQTGIVELATTAEATTGTDTTRAVTPAGLKTVADTKVNATAGEILSIRKYTQAAYDALGTKDPTTLYVIVG